MKIVLDSNVIVAAFSSRGLCSSLFELCLDRYTIMISEFILAEVSRILQDRFKIPSKSVKAVVDYLEEFCVLTSYQKLPKRICRDPFDDEILPLAISSEAYHIITGDKDLLDLKAYQSIKIVSPRQFWAIAKAGN
jgi:putative PIN family toxin of toxin-antitoxin system